MSQTVAVCGGTSLYLNCKFELTRAVLNRDSEWKSHESSLISVSACLSQDLVIEAIYAGIIQAKLDQKNAQVLPPSLMKDCRIGHALEISDGIVLLASIPARSRMLHR